MLSVRFRRRDYTLVNVLGMCIINLNVIDCAKPGPMYVVDSVGGKFPRR